MLSEIAGSLKGTILIIDDDTGLQRAWGRFLRRFTVRHAFTCEEGFASFKGDPPDVVLLDVVLPDGNGIDLLVRLRQVNQSIPIIVTTGQMDMHIAAEAVKVGAYDFLAKPVNTERLRVTVTRALEASRLALEVDRLREESDTFEDNAKGLVLRSKKIREVVNRLKAVAHRNTTVLLLGPSGVGKSELARRLHRLSGRAKDRFIEVNMTTMSQGTLESQLFGHVKGAFTGAVNASKGFFESAQGGTIFLDEIGDIPLSTQVKLLQVLQDRIIYPVGSSTPVEVDVRIVAATVHDLASRVDKGAFREDLYYRLNVFPINVPPLSERKEEIPALAQHFIDRICKQEGLPSKKCGVEFLQNLIDYPWPGNIRELENAIEYALTLARDREELFAADLEGFHYYFSPGKKGALPESSHRATGAYFDAVPEIEADFSLDKHMDELSRKIITFVLARENTNLSRTAAALGITRRRLSLLMKRLNISASPTRGRPHN